MSARSALQILPIKDEYNFLSPNFLTTDLCYSFTNFWFDILLTPLPADFLSKNY